MVFKTKIVVNILKSFAIFSKIDPVWFLDFVETRLASVW